MVRILTANQCEVCASICTAVFSLNIGLDFCMCVWDRGRMSEWIFVQDLECVNSGRQNQLASKRGSLFGAQVKEKVGYGKLLQWWREAGGKLFRWQKEKKGCLIIRVANVFSLGKLLLWLILDIQLLKSKLPLCFPPRTKHDVYLKDGTQNIGWVSPAQCPRLTDYHKISSSEPALSTGTLFLLWLVKTCA